MRALTQSASQHVLLRFAHLSLVLVLQRERGQVSCKMFALCQSWALCFDRQCARSSPGTSAQLQDVFASCHFGFPVVRITTHAVHASAFGARHPFRTVLAFDVDFQMF